MAFWYWWMAGLVLLALEMLVPGYFFMWLAAAAAVTGAVAWLGPGLGLAAQLAVFAVLTVVLLLLSRSQARKLAGEPCDHPTLNKRGQQYVGRVFDLHQPIINGHGKIKVGDTLWKVVGEDCAIGGKVRVVAVCGTELAVERVDGQH